MAIKRSRRRTNFTIMSNVGLQDDRLSFKAKGLLAYMLSLPDDWVFYETEIVKHATDGKQSVRTGMKELQDAGYLIKSQSRNESGEFSKVDWIVYDEPQNIVKPTFPPSTEKPSTDKPTTEKPSTDNQPLLSTNSTKNLSIQSTDNTKDTMSSSGEHDDAPSIPYKEVIDCLNKKTGSKYRHTTKKTKELIKARYNEGFTLEDFKQVIDIKTAEWQGTDMSKYLRPETLFGTKFEGYLNQMIEAPTEQEGWLNEYDFF